MPVKMYPYAVGRIRALEKKLRDKSKLELMATAKNADDAFKVLLEADYGYGNVQNAKDYEVLLKEELEKTYGLLESLAPNEGIFDVFILQNDFLNIKTMLKQELTKRDGQDYYAGRGKVPVSVLEAAVRDRDFRGLDRNMELAVNEALAAYAKRENPQDIDVAVDNFTYDAMYDAAVKTKTGFIIELVRIMIDLSNIKAFLRIRKSGQEQQLLRRTVADNGKVGAEVYYGMLHAPDEQVRTAFGEYEKVVDFALGGGFTAFEKAADNYILEYCKKSKYMPLTVEPLVGYLIAKETEAKSVRIIMVSKYNDIGAETIRERLRDAYV